MKAIEFVSEEQNGAITVPEEFRSSLTKQFRVIILLDDQTVSKNNSSQLSDARLKTKDLTIDRDELHER